MRKLSMEELERKSVDDFRAADKFPLVLVLDNVRSMHNVGSVFRSSDGFLIEAIYLCGYTPQPPHRDINKTALGATETVAWTYFNNTKDAVFSLREKGFKILSVEQAENSISLENVQWDRTSPLALVFGNEVDGVAQEVIDLCDGCIEIPQWGMKHSLNISVAAGIVLWEMVRSSKKE